MPRLFKKTKRRQSRSPARSLSRLARLTHYPATYIVAGAILILAGSYIVGNQNEYSRNQYNGSQYNRNQNNINQQNQKTQNSNGTLTSNITSNITDSFSRRRSNLPSLSARAYLVIDIDNGKVLASRNDFLPVPIASLTKLMTALVAKKTVPDDLRLTLDGNLEKADQYLEEKTLAVSDLYIPLLLRSSNASANALSIPAVKGGQKFFVKMMNNMATRIGMTKTHFADPTGISENNTSTARDLARLVSYIKQYEPTILEVSAMRQAIIKSAGVDIEITNINGLSADPNYIGGKNGYTPEAGKTLIAIFKKPAQNAATGQTVGQTAGQTTDQTTDQAPGQANNLAYIILGSDNKDKDFGMLAEWIEKNQ